MKIPQIRVKTDYDGCPYITAGKIYDLRDPGVLTSGEVVGGVIVNDGGVELSIYIPESSHLGYRAWEIVQVDAGDDTEEHF